MRRREGAEAEVADPTLAPGVDPHERREEVPLEPDRRRGAARREDGTAQRVENTRAPEEWS